MDQFREPSGNGPGAVFARFLDPKLQGLGAQKRTKIEVGSKKGDLQQTLQKTMNFQYSNGLKWPEVH